MKFKISNMSTISVDYGDLADDFWINMQVDISEIDGRGAETFNVSVVGPHRLHRILESGNTLIGRGIIFANVFTTELVSNIVNDLLRKSKATNWEIVIKELSKYFELQ